MIHFVKNTSEFIIDLNTIENYFFISSHWQYSFKNKAGTTPWTEPEKMNFHNRADQLIWRCWSSKYQLQVKGTSDFAKKNLNTLFTVNFDIKRVYSNPHWTVEAIKILPGDFNQSHIKWFSHQITLDTEDVKLFNRFNSAKTYGQYPISHEFGHVTGNIPLYGLHGDEYLPASIYHSDTSSILNIGNQIRARHYDYLLMILNDPFFPFIADTHFYV